jgi:hypothetical protein
MVNTFTKGDMPIVEISFTHLRANMFIKDDTQIAEI